MSTHILISSERAALYVHILCMLKNNVLTGTEYFISGTGPIYFPVFTPTTFFSIAQHPPEQSYRVQYHHSTSFCLQAGLRWSLRLCSVPVRPCLLIGSWAGFWCPFQQLSLPVFPVSPLHKLKYEYMANHFSQKMASVILTQCYHAGICSSVFFFFFFLRYDWHDRWILLAVSPVYGRDLVTVAPNICCAD